MTRSQGADLVIVGNGIIGLSVAARIKRDAPDLDVLVIGPGDRVGGATPAAGAMLGCHGEITKYTLASEAGRAKLDMAEEAHGAWPEFIADLNDISTDAAEIDPVRSTFVVLNGRSGLLDSENYSALLAYLADRGVPHEEVDTVPGLDPTPDARPLRAVHLVDEGAVDARAVVARLEALADAHGVRWLDAQVERLTENHGRVSGCILEGGVQVACDSVVVAAGSASGSLLDSVLPRGEVQPIFSGSGVAYLTRRVLGAGFPAVVRSVNRAGSCGLHVIPLGESVEYLGATNVIFGEPETLPHLGVVGFLVDSAIDQLDRALTYSRILETRVGNRPVPLDTYPLLGETSIPGLLVLTGTYRDGFHAAPLLARLASKSVLGGSSAFPAVFTPGRTPLLGGTREDAIREFAFQNVSSAFENGIRLSRFMDHDDLEHMYRPSAEALFDRLGLEHGLPPDIVTYLVLTRKDPAEVDRVGAYLAGTGLSPGPSR